MKGYQIRPWLKALLRPAPVFAVAVIVLCWIGFAHVLSVERASVLDAAIERNTAFAELFEATAVRVFRSIDRSLLLLRQAYESDPEHFDLDQWKVRTGAGSDVATDIGLVDANGYLKRKTGYSGPPIYIGDRDHFRSQVDPGVDEPQISTPIVLRTTGKLSIQLTRRLRKSDGSFAGVMVANVDPSFVAQFHRSLTLGEHSDIVMRRRDGALLASEGYAPAAADPMGQPLQQAIAAASSGHFWTHGAADGTNRLVAYRVIDDYPLILGVGESEQHIFEEYQRHVALYVATASILTLLALLVIAVSIHSWLKIEKSQSSLRRAHDHLMAAITNMPQGLTMFDRDQRLLVCNERYVELYRLPPELAMPGCHFRAILDYRSQQGTFVGDVARYMEETRGGIAQGVPYTSTTTLPDGRTIARIHRPMRDGGWIVTHDDITERKRSEAKIEQLAHYDPLTNLANRYLFKERIEEALARLRRTRTEFAVFMLDLDKFKTVNDTLGHQAGDALLREIALRINSTIREADDVAARLGGDEFAVIVQSGSGVLHEGSIRLAKRLIAAIGAPYAIGGQEVVVGCSIGIAFAPEHGKGSDQLLRSADLALYKSKTSGRNCFHVYSSDLKVEADNRNALENDLREAIWREELELFYQPVVDVRTGRVRAVEALARWRHPTKGLIAPSDFIQLAEETGLIVQLGEWAMIKACQDALLMPDDVKLAINLSPVQFAKSNLVDAVIFALVDAQLPPERLELEITEGVLLKETEQNVETLRQIKNLGVSIALDDFGVGYSSLSYLTSFPFDKVKIDRTFVQKLDRPECKAVIRSIIQLSRTLNLTTCAEGIETEAQLADIRALNIELGQGYLFSQPQRLADLDLSIAYAADERAHMRGREQSEVEPIEAPARAATGTRR